MVRENFKGGGYRIQKTSCYSLLKHATITEIIKWAGAKTMMKSGEGVGVGGCFNGQIGSTVKSPNVAFLPWL